MDKLQFIKEKCIEANPDIKKLQFGCEVYDKETNLGRVTLINGVVNGDSYAPWSYGVIDTASKDVEIIGRPITLADIILATKDCWKKEHFCECGLNGGLDTLIGKWNLKETLDNQSKETISLIANILGYKNNG